MSSEDSSGGNSNKRSISDTPREQQKKYKAVISSDILNNSSNLLSHSSPSSVSSNIVGASLVNLSDQKITMMNHEMRHNSMKKKAPVKKMVIKPFKNKPKLPKNYELSTWQKLHDAVVAVQTKQAVSFSLEDLYRSVEDLCTWKMSESLYARLESSCSKHIEEIIQALVNISMDPVVFLTSVETAWQDHCHHMLTIRNIFLYLDRTYAIQTVNVRSIWDMGLYLFRANLESRPELGSKLIQDILSLIESERQGQSVNRSLLLNLLRMLSALQIYKSRFETPFVEATEVFYASEGNRLMEQTDVPQFLLHVENSLHEEADRVLHYLDVSTKRALIYAVETHLFKPHTTTIFEKGFHSLMDGNRTGDLQRLFQLCGRVDRVDELKAALGQYIREKGLAIVGNNEEEKQMVERLLQLKDQLDKLLASSFQNEKSFLFTLKDAMEHSLNSRQNRPAELIAKFIDHKLRTGGKGGTEEEIELTLDRIMVLFRYIQGKDVFEAFYKKDLAKRLLLGKSASFDLEKSMISKLKTECGNSFTNKLEGMFKDVDLSRNVMIQFQQHGISRNAIEKLGREIEMDVQVLTTGFWPPYVPMEIRMPSELVPYQAIFNKFYMGKYQGRQLQWQHSLGHCIVKAAFPKGKKELSVSLFQTLVLLCFNNADEIKFLDIKEQTGIEDAELRRTLQSLACAKIRVLHKQPKGREVEDNDVFVYNSGFVNKLIRIKINSIQMKETVKENKETHERIFRDRQYQVDAAIVRIMKSRKKLSHTLLMSEVYSQLRFPAKPADIKKRIESLIDREYLERDEGAPNVYNYLA